MTDDQIKHMVNRFLGWRLPEYFTPDNGISFEPEYNVEFNASQGILRRVASQSARIYSTPSRRRPWFAIWSKGCPQTRRQQSMGQDVEQWRSELRAAGWKPLRHTVWQAPCGCVYLGPWRAWTVMLARKASDMPCPNDHSHHVPLEIG